MPTTKYKATYSLNPFTEIVFKDIDEAQKIELLKEEIINFINNYLFKDFTQRFFTFRIPKNIESKIFSGKCDGIICIT